MGLCRNRPRQTLLRILVLRDDVCAVIDVVLGSIFIRLSDRVGIRDRDTLGLVVVILKRQVPGFKVGHHAPLVARELAQIGYPVHHSVSWAHDSDCWSLHWMNDTPNQRRPCLRAGS